MAEIGKLIRSGANTFLAKSTKLWYALPCAAVLIFVFLPEPIWKSDILSNISMAVSYICGTVFSAIAGKIGISIATIANMKSAEAATKGIKPSFMAGYRGGAVMGMAVVGASLLGVTLVYLITGETTAILGFHLVQVH